MRETTEVKAVKDLVTKSNEAEATIKSMLEDSEKDDIAYAKVQEYKTHHQLLLLRERQLGRALAKVEALQGKIVYIRDTGLLVQKLLEAKGGRDDGSSE